MNETAPDPHQQQPESYEPPQGLDLGPVGALTLSVGTPGSVLLSKTKG
jgi:hypothetical protein